MMILMMKCLLMNGRLKVVNKLQVEIIELYVDRYKEREYTYINDELYVHLHGLCTYICIIQTMHVYIT